MRHCFIIGTDTDVGKTFITAGLLRALRKQARDAVMLKPVQTGVPRGEELVSSDLAFVARAADWDLSPENLGDYMPYCFEPACSPHLAERMEHRTIEFDVLVESARRLAARHEHVLVEGAGGLLSPIGESGLSRDLVQKLAWPALIVADNRLGMINHTFLTVRCLEQAGIPIAGLVVNHRSECPEEDRYLREENTAMLDRAEGFELLAELPFSEADDSASEALWTTTDDVFSSLARRLFGN